MIKFIDRLFLVILVFFLSACAENSIPLPTPTSTPKPIPTSTPLPTPTATPDFDMLLEPGWEALSSENYEIAESVADEILASNNQHGNSWMVKGLSKYYRADFRKAISDFKQAKEFEAENADQAIEDNYIGLFNEVLDNINNIWDINQALIYINELQALFLIVYELNPDSPFIQEYGEIILSPQDDYASSEGINDEALEYFYIAEEHFSRGNYESAITEYKKALEIDPDFILANLYLGDSYYFLNDFVNSELYIKKVLDLEPYFSQAWAYLGEIYRKIELPQHSKEAYIRALLLDPESLVAISGFEMIQEKGSWVTDYFKDFGFQLDYPEAEEIELHRDGGTGNVNMLFGNWYVNIYWSPTLSSFSNNYEQNQEVNLYIINNVFMENEGVDFIVLDERAYEFLYGVTEFAVQPYLYSLPNEDYYIDSALVSARCGHHSITLDFEFGFDTTEYLELFLAPILESFRCDLETHEWFPN